LIICVAERTLLPILIPAKEASAFPERLKSSLSDALREMGVSGNHVAAELDHMNSFGFYKTASRRILGSINDFVRMLEGYNGIGMSLSEISRRLAEAPCSPLGMESPNRATPRLFDGQPTLRILK